MIDNDKVVLRVFLICMQLICKTKIQLYLGLGVGFVHIKILSSFWDLRYFVVSFYILSMNQILVIFEFSIRFLTFVYVRAHTLWLRQSARMGPVMQRDHFHVLSLLSLRSKASF